MAEDRKPRRYSRREVLKIWMGAGLSLPVVGGALAACTTVPAGAPAPTAPSGGGAAAAPTTAAAAPAAGSVTLQFWKFVDETPDKLIKQWTDQWNTDNPATQVAFQTFPFDQYTGPKLTTAFAAGAPPDIFWISAGDFLRYVNQKSVLALPSDLVGSMKQDFSEAAIAALTVAGEMYGMPIEQEPVALYYNTDMFSQGGVQPPQTWTEMVDAATKLKTDQVAGIVVEPAQGVYQNFTWYPFLWSGGGDVVNADWTKATIDQAPGANAYQLWGDLITKGLAPSKLPTGTNDIAPFGTEKAAMQVCGFWAVRAMNEQYPDVNYSVVKIPIPDGGKYVTVYGGWSQQVSRGSKNAEAALKFTQWMWFGDPNREVDWFTKVNTKFCPRKTVLEVAKDFYQQGKNAIFTNDVMPTARAEPRFPPEIVKAVGDGLQAAMFKGMSGQDAANQAAATINDFLGTYSGAH